MEIVFVCRHKRLGLTKFFGTMHVRWMATRVHSLSAVAVRSHCDRRSVEGASKVRARAPDLPQRQCGARAGANETATCAWVGRLRVYAYVAIAIPLAHTTNRMVDLASSIMLSCTYSQCERQTNTHTHTRRNAAKRERNNVSKELQLARTHTHTLNAAVTIFRSPAFNEQYMAFPMVADAAKRCIIIAATTIRPNNRVDCVCVCVRIMKEYPGANSPDFGHNIQLIRAIHTQSSRTQSGPPKRIYNFIMDKSMAEEKSLKQRRMKRTLI